VFTKRLIKSILVFLASLSTFFLLGRVQGSFKITIMHATVVQALLYNAFGLLRLAILIITIISGIAVWSYLLMAYEAGAKVLNKREQKDL
jgi:hypothetical protein